jgi:hypothetical protein
LNTFACPEATDGMDAAATASRATLPHPPNQVDIFLVPESAFGLVSASRLE